MSQTTERAFETYVEEILLTRGGWKSGGNVEWDKGRALFPMQVFALIADTQPKLSAEMQPLLEDEVARRGYVHIAGKFRHAEDFGPRTVRLFVEEPAALGEMTPEQVQTDAFMQVSALLRGLWLQK